MPNKGFKHSEYSKKQISLHSASRKPEIRKKISKALKGRISPYKGRIDSKETRMKKRLAHLGFRHSIKSRLAMARKHRGSKSYFWRGGVNAKNNTIRNSIKYKIWRERVFKRDDYSCVFCNKRGGKLNADHIKPFAYYPSLRFVLNNGRTLCIPCHKKTNTFGKNEFN